MWKRLGLPKSDDDGECSGNSADDVELMFHLDRHSLMFVLAPKIIIIHSSVLLDVIFSFLF